MKIFVTGGSGFIGSNLIELLVAKGHQVAATSTYGKNNPHANHLFGRNLRQVNEEITKFNDVVFHLAANNETQSTNEEAMFEANVHAPLSLLERFADAGCKQFIYASTTAVYGNSSIPYVEDTTSLEPLTAYARSKLEFERRMAVFAKERGVNAIGLRYASVYGPGESYKGSRASMIRQMIAACSCGESPSLFWDGCQKRDWVYIADVIQATYKASELKSTEVINIGTGRSWSFHEVLDIINKNIHYSYRISGANWPAVLTR
jgi:ADP-L-glycero-D-manno-heptose 6-epimerase